jgi:hypothetical protein
MSDTYTKTLSEYETQLLSFLTDRKRMGLKALSRNLLNNAEGLGKGKD